MLFESMQFKDNLPFSISFSNVAQENKHCHKGIELALVLRGTTNYQIYHTDYELNPGDLIIADVEDLHQIHNSSEDFLVLILHVDIAYFEKEYPNIRYMFFVCEECMSGPSGSNQILQSKLAVLKNAIAKLALDYSENKSSNNSLKDGISHIISILVNHFQGFFMEDYQYKTSQENISNIDLERLSRITRYILLNYNQKITLEDVSNMEHLSLYYVSHLVKKTLGFNFQSFVNAVRLEFAEKMLVFSNKSLMQISEDCGFSSPNYFNKCFSAWHGKTPAQYRKEYESCDRSFHAELRQEDAFGLLTPYLNLIGAKEENGGLVLVPDFNSEVGEAYTTGYAPEIVISASSEVMRLGFLAEKIKKIKPRGFVLSREFLQGIKCCEELSSFLTVLRSFGIPISAQWSKERTDKRLLDTLSSLGVEIIPISEILTEDVLLAPLHAASAAERILHQRKKRVLLFGEDCKALFASGGLPTPSYLLYRFFAELAHPYIKVEGQWAEVRSEGGLAILLFNINPHAVLSASMRTERLPENFFLLHTEIAEEENCFHAIGQLGSPETLPQLLQRRLETAWGGKTTFSVVEKSHGPALSFIVYQNSLMILEIMN